MSHIFGIRQAMLVKSNTSKAKASWLPNFVPAVWAIIAHGLGHRCPQRVHPLPTLWALSEEKEMARECCLLVFSYKGITVLGSLTLTYTKENSTGKFIHSPTIHQSTVME